jgi:hypothetical protein
MTHSLELKIEDNALVVELITTDDDYDVPWIEATARISLVDLGKAIEAARLAQDGDNPTETEGSVENA